MVQTLRAWDKSVGVQLYLLNFCICIKRGRVANPTSPKCSFVLTTPVRSLLRHRAWCPGAKDSSCSIESLPGKVNVVGVFSKGAHCIRASSMGMSRGGV